MHTPNTKSWRVLVATGLLALAVAAPQARAAEGRDATARSDASGDAAKTNPKGATAPDTTVPGATGPDAAASTPAAGGVPAATPAEPGAPLTTDEALRQQGELLREMQSALVKQQAEIERLRTELDAVHASAASAAAPSAVAGVDSGAPVLASSTVAASPAGAGAQAADDTLKKQVDELTKRWGNLKLSGDLRFRYEGFFNQGFDALNDVDPRNRLRYRARVQLTGAVDKHFDWGLRVATGSFDDPISTNQTADNYFNRKPFAVDRAFLHFDTKTKGADLEIYAGKFDYTWKRTPLTFDNDLQPEGVSEVLKFDVGDDTPLRGLKLTAFQLPYKERSVGADAALFGGQVLTDWKWSDNFATTLSGTFYDWEQINVIPPVVGVSSTLVNAGFDYGTTNTVVINPFTNLPEYRSDYRVIDAIAEFRYTGIDKHNGETKWPLAIRANWIHNTSAYNNQKDGGLAVAEIGRRADKGDWFLAYELYKIEREATPSVFNESDILQTNAINHRATVAYSYSKQIEFDAQYIWSRRLQTTSPENRWLNRVQLDVMYKF